MGNGNVGCSNGTGTVLAWQRTEPFVYFLEVNDLEHVEQVYL